MSLGVILIIAGILLALFLHWTLGVLCIIAGVVVLILPHVRT